jgi:hypothetical protein
VQKELTLEEFHASDPQRAVAPEVPYGSLWREFAPVPTYRLAWVPATGELYAMELSETDEDKDPVEVLGVLWSRPQVEAEEWSRVVDRGPGMITRRLPDPALVGRSAPPS